MAGLVKWKGAFSRPLLEKMGWACWTSAFLFLLAFVLLPPSRAGEDVSPVRIIVAFQKTATQGQIQELEKRHGLKMISDLPAANSRVYLLTGSNDFQKALKEISAESITRYAELDQKVSID
jgi:hypothetical protein